MSLKENLFDDYKHSKEHYRNECKNRLEKYLLKPEFEGKKEVTDLLKKIIKILDMSTEKNWKKNANKVIDAHSKQ